jgi:Arm DNA-binding domain
MRSSVRFRAAAPLFSVSHSNSSVAFTLVMPGAEGYKGRLWRLRYRYGKLEKLLSLGNYPDVSPKRAREKRDEARRLLADGVDPSAQRRTNQQAQGETFEVIARVAGAPGEVDEVSAFGAFAQSGDAEYFIVPYGINQTAELLYKVTSAGVASLVYTSVGNLGGSPGVVDANNLYFIDTQTIWEASLQSADVQPLYTISTGSSPSLIGSNGSVLIYGYSGYNGAATIETIPVNEASKTASAFASFTGTYFSSAFLDSSATHLYLNYLSPADEPGTAAFAVGTAEQLQASSSSMFIQAAADVLLLSGVAAADAPGGSTIYDFDPSSATQTPLQLANGSPYTVPQGYSSITALASGGIGAINLRRSSGTTATSAVYDASSHLIVPLGLTNTNVSVW